MTEFKPISSVAQGLIKRQHRQAENSHDIVLTPPTNEDKGFYSKLLLQVTLPHKDPGKVEAWTRRNGDTTLVVQPGWDTEKNQSIGYPFGTVPRLVLLWLTTYLVHPDHKDSNRVELGHSLSQWMFDLGMNPANGTGKRSDARRLQRMIERLFRSRITLTVKPQARGSRTFCAESSGFSAASHKCEG